MTDIKPAEISKLIRQKIQNYDKVMQVDNVGKVIRIGDGIARIFGLEKVMAGELLEFEDNDKIIFCAAQLLVLALFFTKNSEGLHISSLPKKEGTPYSTAKKI